MTTKQPLKIASQTILPTKYGDFILCGFAGFKDGKEHVALVHGEIAGKQDVPLRIHSECLTGDAFGSLRCDCGPQLLKSLEALSKKRCGVLLYLRQEGRGIGLLNKIKAYELQDRGLDTFDANIALGFKPDERTYEAAIGMIKALGIRSIQLQTNNPEKIRALKKAGLLSSRTPHETKSNQKNKRYLQTKKEKFGHLLS